MRIVIQSSRVCSNHYNKSVYLYCIGITSIESCFYYMKRYNQKNM